MFAQSLIEVSLIISTISVKVVQLIVHLASLADFMIHLFRQRNGLNFDRISSLTSDFYLEHKNYIIDREWTVIN